MVHRAWVGATAGVLGYIILGLIVIAIPHPLAKWAGAAMLFPGPMYGVVAAAGAAVTMDWGHGGETQLEALSSREITRMVGGYCDPDDPPWWC